MGGRGQKSNLSGIPKNKRKSLESYKKNIKEHQEKIENAIRTGENKRAIPHWQHEINVFKNNIEKIERKYKK